MEGVVQEDQVGVVEEEEPGLQDPTVGDEAALEEEAAPAAVEEKTMTLAEYMASKNANGGEKIESGREVENEFSGVSAAKKKEEEDFFNGGGSKQKKVKKKKEEEKKTVAVGFKVVRVVFALSFFWWTESMSHEVFLVLT